MLALAFSPPAITKYRRINAHPGQARFQGNIFIPLGQIRVFQARFCQPSQPVCPYKRRKCFTKTSTLQQDLVSTLQSPT